MFSEKTMVRLELYRGRGEGRWAVVTRQTLAIWTQTRQNLSHGAGGGGGGKQNLGGGKQYLSNIFDVLAIRPI